MKKVLLQRIELVERVMLQEKPLEGEVFSAQEVADYLELLSSQVKGYVYHHQKELGEEVWVQQREDSKIKDLKFSRRSVVILCIVSSRRSKFSSTILEKVREEMQQETVTAYKIDPVSIDHNEEELPAAPPIIEVMCTEEVIRRLNKDRIAMEYHREHLSHYLKICTILGIDKEDAVILTQDSIVNGEDCTNSAILGHLVKRRTEKIDRMKECCDSHLNVLADEKFNGDYRAAFKTVQRELSFSTCIDLLAGNVENVSLEDATAAYKETMEIIHAFLAE